MASRKSFQPSFGTHPVPRFQATVFIQSHVFRQRFSSSPTFSGNVFHPVPSFQATFFIRSHVRVGARTEQLQNKVTERFPRLIRTSIHPHPTPPHPHTFDQPVLGSGEIWTNNSLRRPAEGREEDFIIICLRHLSSPAQQQVQFSATAVKDD